MKNHLRLVLIGLTLLVGVAYPLRPAELTEIVLSQYQYTGLDPNPTVVTNVFTSSNYSFLAGTHYRNSFFLYAENFSYLPYGVFFGTTEFEAPNASLLAPGAYLNVMQFPENPPGTAGLDISIDSLGLDNFSAQFTVFEAVYDPNNVMQHFGATFEIFTPEGEPAWTGAAYYNYDLPSMNVPEPTTWPLAGLLLLAAIAIPAVRRHGPAHSCQSILSNDPTVVADSLAW